MPKAHTAAKALAATLAFAALLAALALPARAATEVPPSATHEAAQPPVPGASARRTAAIGSTYERKYRKVYALLANDRKLRAKIAQAAGQFGISPLHIAGAIVGEHTYNVDAYDRLQTYYVKAVSYLKSDISFAYDGEAIGDFVRRPQFAPCDAASAGSEALWSCRERVWNKSFRGRTVDGRAFPDNRLGAIFFQPFYAGQTFGIGQLNPLTALKVSDAVSRVTGLPRLSADRPREIYQTIMDPDLTLPYVAATLRDAIDAYAAVGFDISGNPGITATLYNVGNPEDRAAALQSENRARTAKGQTPRLPEENYYGWLVNEKLAELQALF
jgi:hypothetical protein